MKTTIWKLAMVLVAGLFSLMVCGSGIAAKGGIPGPPTGGETSNNLSVPGVLTGSAITTGHNWIPPAEPQLGVHYSYGCDTPEGNEQFNYPNTSCVDNLDNPTVYYTADECTAEGLPCEGLPVSRIYWQKVDANEWSADAEGAISTTDDPSRSVDYVDWGDALEAVSWSERSVIRVETQPYYSTIEGFDPIVNYCGEVATDPDPTAADSDCKVGLQMWHVSGQGITEHWGVRATDPDPLLDEESVSFNYDSPFQIIHTSNARLNLARLVPGSAICPEPGGNANEQPPEVVGVEWIDNGDGSRSWAFPDGVGGWDDACEVYDELYTVELSVGGKYVFGYNLRMGDVDLDSIDGCEGYAKTGYYRLTFYAPDDVIFDDPFLDENGVCSKCVAPPAVPAVVRALPRIEFNTVTGPAPDPVLIVEGFLAEEDEDPDADDRLYIPVIDDLNNLTYLDICIVAKTQGGGGGGGGGKSSGGGGGGGRGGGRGK